MSVHSQATRVMLSAAFLSVLGCSAAPESDTGGVAVGVDTLIGPVLGGGSSGRLCLNPAEHTPGSFGALFLRAHRTRALEALVLSDR